MNHSATITWRELLTKLMISGSGVSQNSAGAAFKGRRNIEVIGLQTQWDMCNPVITCKVRKLGYRFMAAEAAWILSGDNRLSTIQPFSKAMENFSDDKLMLAGAYGPMFVDQAPYVIKTLEDDMLSRQAVINIWRPRTFKTKDTPCTLSLQWFVRPMTGALEYKWKMDCIATMRSSDVMTGVPYDIFSFSMMTAWLAIALNMKLSIGDKVKPGFMLLNVGSQHLYMDDFEQARECANAKGYVLEVNALDILEFVHPDQLTAHLWSLARREPIAYEWLSEIRRKEIRS